MRAWLILLVGVVNGYGPVIGIYTQTDDSDQPTTKHLHKAPTLTYIAASYVKFIELAGAQVVPIYGYSEEKDLLQVLKKVNGVLFPGGGEPININNKWTRNAAAILAFAMKENDAGRVFPLWGTCLGMQLLAYLTGAYDSKIIAPVRGEVGVLNTINFTPSASYLFDGFPAGLRTKLSKGQGVLYFNHHYAVTSDYYSRSAPLRLFWSVVATTTTSFNEEFLSVAEGKNYPFYAIQFHPEKNLFQWKVFADRTDAGAEVVQLLANKFIDKARLNPNQFDSLQDFTKHSIYMHNVSYTNMSFSTVYLFNQDTHALIK